MNSEGDLEEPRIREIETFVQAQDQHVELGLDTMAQHVAVVLGSRHPPHYGYVRAQGLVEMQEDRSRYSGGDPSLDAPQRVRRMVRLTAAKSVREIR